MASTDSARPPVVLFGYDSSPFTTKGQEPGEYHLFAWFPAAPACENFSILWDSACAHKTALIIVPSMMPRPILKDNFNITYRKIPVLAIGREIYIDTSLILEALEHYFPSSAGYGTLYPPPSAAYRPIIRGFASYWTDRPLFRVTTGLIPSSVWRTHFGIDRANLIGHQLDADKLEKKVPENLSGLDLQLSLLEPLFSDISSGKKWVFEGEKPSAADVALWYQLDWGNKISRGEGIQDLTGGGAKDGDGEGMTSVFNRERYPGLIAWFEQFGEYLDALPSTETRIERKDEEGTREVLEQLRQASLSEEIPLLPTPAGAHRDLDRRNGFVMGAEVNIAPDDTGRGSPTVGTLQAITPEEIVITPQKADQGEGPTVGDVRVHFPRVGFTIRLLGQARL